MTKFTTTKTQPTNVVSDDAMHRPSDLVVVRLTEGARQISRASDHNAAGDLRHEQQ
jgi:hypothetical protein